MQTPDVMAQMKIFVKYYNSAFKDENLGDFHTANLLLKKIVPQLEEMADGKNNLMLAGMFEMFSDFIYTYYRISEKKSEPTSHIEPQLRWLAEKAIALNSDSFWGYYFLTVSYSFNIIPLGNTNVTTLIDKGVSAVSKSKFSSTAEETIKRFRKKLAQNPFSAKEFLKMTESMFDLAEICHFVFISNRLRKDIFTVIREIDINTLDYSEFDEGTAEEAKEKAMEMIILTDASI